MIKAFLFDLGGVVIDVKFERVFQSIAKFAKKRPEEIRKRFSFDHFYCEFERGEISPAEYFDSLRKSLAIDIPDENFITSWNKIFGGEIDGVFDYLNSLKNKINIYAFSNTNSIHYNYFSKEYASILSLFKEIFLSFELRKRKPEKAAFVEVAKLMNVSCNEILFFDDLEENIRAAEELGVRTVLVKSFADLDNVNIPE